MKHRRAQSGRAAAFVMMATAGCAFLLVSGAVGWTAAPGGARGALRARPVLPRATTRLFEGPPPLLPRPPTPNEPLSTLQQVSLAFAAGFALALALQFSTTVDDKSLANVQALDRQLENPDVCLSYGAGAMVLDQRIFMSLNPLKVYVAPTSVKSGCVLRMSNWRVLQKEDLISEDDMKNCKMAFNTFAFTGDLRGSDGKPEVACVYESDDNQIVDKAVDNVRKAAQGWTPAPQ